MKYYRICGLLFLILFLWGQVFAQKHPSFETVLTQLFTQNRVPSKLSFQLEKRPQGYFLQWKNENAYPVEYFGAPQILWDARKPSWQKIKLPPSYSSATSSVFGIDDPAEKARFYIREKNFEAEAMDLFPYYGYTAWYDDVIALLSKKCPECSDDEMFSLGYAYSRAAQSLLNNNQSWADSSKIFQLPHRQPSLTNEQVAQYRQLAHQSAQWYEKLQARTSNYRTRVGSIALKQANEYMDIFLTLWYYQDLETALSVLPQRPLYDAWLLEAARNKLKSCPKDAVLITYGDTDTYLPLYVQATEHLRPDVLVVNSSLLQTPRYCSAVVRGMFPGSKPLPVSFPEIFYQTITIVISGNGMHYFSANDLLDKLKKGPLEEGFYGITQIQVDHASFERLQLPPAPATASFLQKAVPEPFWGTEMYFASGDQLLPLAVVTQGQWQRPLCYALTCQEALLAPWEGHLVQEGWVYRVYPDSVLSDAVNIPMSRDFWNNVQFVVANGGFAADYMPFYGVFVRAGMLWCKAELNESGPEAARTAAQRMLQCFPSTQYPRDTYWIPLVETLAAAGDTEQARSLGKEISATVLSRAASEGTQAHAQLQSIAQKYGWPPF